MITVLEELAHQAREHAASLINDVEQASTREEHIRLTARANEAELLTEMITRILIEEMAKDQ